MAEYFAGVNAKAIGVVVLEALSGLPSKNIQYLIFIVGALKKVEGRVKLFKLHHLLETEGRIKFDEPDEENKMGYTQFAALETCIQKGFISQNTEPGFVRDCYAYSLTPAGETLFEVLKKRAPKKELSVAMGVLEKYKGRSGWELIQITHQKYIDDFSQTQLAQLSKQYADAISTIQELIRQLEKDRQTVAGYLMVGKLDHVKAILKELRAKKVKKVQAGAVLDATQQLILSLKATGSLPDDASEELFDYIDNYADKEGIFPSVGSEDLSRLSEEDKKCLSAFLNQVRLPLSS